MTKRGRIMSDEKPTTDQGDGGGGSNDETKTTTEEVVAKEQPSSVLDDLGVDSPSVPTGLNFLNY